MLIVGNLNHINLDSGLPGKGRKQHADGLAGQILDGQKADAVFLNSGRKGIIVESVIFHDNLLFLRGSRLRLFPAGIYDLLRYVSSHQLIIQLISAHGRIDSDALAGQRIYNRHFLIRIILMGHPQIIGVLLAHGNHGVKILFRSQDIKGLVKPHAVVAGKYFAGAIIVLQHIHHTINKAFIVGIDAVLTEQSHILMAILDTLNRDIPSRLLKSKGYVDRRVRHSLYLSFGKEKPGI